MMYLVFGLYVGLGQAGGQLEKVGIAQKLLLMGGMKAFGGLPLISVTLLCFLFKKSLLWAHERGW